MKEIKGVSRLYSSKEGCGTAEIHKYVYKNEEHFLYNLRALRDVGDFYRMVDGTYVRLIIDGQLMMSDTRMERITNKEIISKANGKVLIAGLGLGLVIHNIKNKKEVKEITVIENNEDVIELVADKFIHKKVKIIHGDIFEYAPEQKYDCIYFDIWAMISTDNLEEMKTLHKKFKPYLNESNPNHFMESWLREYLQKRKRKGY